jgi:dephospho-CoA kinase
MKVVGLLGGVASGKSLVARQLCDLGAGLLDGDRAGHEVLRLPEVEGQVRERWGGVAFAADGHVDRRALARIVFAPAPNGPRELEHLERITHPHITHRLREQAAMLAADGLPVAVLDAPVMLKAGWNEFCDTIVFVDASKEVREARAQLRGWSQEDFAAREAAQEPLEVKRRLADTIVDNSGSPQATRAQVERLWQSLVG